MWKSLGKMVAAAVIESFLGSFLDEVGRGLGRKLFPEEEEEEDEEEEEEEDEGLESIDSEGETSGDSKTESPKPGGPCCGEGCKKI